MKQFLFVTIILITSFSFGQNKYMIYFKDKGIKHGESLTKTSVLYQEALNNLTKRAIDRRKKNMGDEIIKYEDLPIREDYTNELNSLGIEVIHKLTWFNAVSANINDEQLIDIKALPFVEKIEAIKKLKYKNDEIPENSLEKGSSLNPNLEYGNSFGQLELCNIPIVHSKGITGEGIIIGLLDSGFDWNDHEALINADVIDEWDFVFNDSVTANQNDDSPSQHNHGTNVMSVVGGFQNGTLIGASFGSSFLLAKTEYVPTETNVEEDNYAAALIWMENYGVDITSSSLGYSEFDAGQSSYTYQDMDGQTTIVTQACELAFDRGIVTIASAGNEGNGSWHYITAPADGFNTIAVGAVTSLNEVAGFSGRGPTFDGRIKPDIVTQGVGVFAASASGFTSYSSSFGGTSAAAPIACGVAGLLLSAHPHLTNVQVRKILLKTAGSSTAPDNNRGYGLLSAQNAINYPNLESIGNSFKMHKIFINNISIDPSTLKLHYSIDGEDFIETNILFDGSFRYNYIFPELFNNQFLEFYFTYNDSSFGSYREPSVSNYGQIVRDTEVVEVIPSDFNLTQNYPNPFNNQTRIDFSSPINEVTLLEIYNILGQKVKVLFNDVPSLRLNSVYWDGRNEFGSVVSSGVYYYVLRIGEKAFSKKMVFLK